jgi:hypothetical protein
MIWRNACVARELIVAQIRWVLIDLWYLRVYSQSLISTTKDLQFRQNSNNDDSHEVVPHHGLASESIFDLSFRASQHSVATPTHLFLYTRREKVISLL